jgi:hypothetical protein
MIFTIIVISKKIEMIKLEYTSHRSRNKQYQTQINNTKQWNSTAMVLKHRRPILKTGCSQ